MTGYERRKLRKREQILKAAEQLFRRQGFRKTTIDEVASLAGVSKVTVYNHFDDKRRLVEESLRMVLHDKLTHYTEILTSEEPWLERLDSIIRDKIRTVREYGGEYLETLYKDLPALVEEIRTFQLQIRNQYTFTFFDEGRELGFVPKDISNEAIAIYLECFARGLNYSEDIQAKLGAKPEYAEGLIRLMTYGIIKPAKQ
jgi:AcrR family transcriptional regulator